MWPQRHVRAVPCFHLSRAGVDARVRFAAAVTRSLLPVILDALAEDRITTEHCQALALENDTARQVQVFEAACQSGWGGKPDVRVIRNLITESEVVVAGNSKFRFVGADAFSPDELRTDLFSDDGDGYVDRVALDAALLEKLQAVAEYLREAEGWE